MPIAHRWETRHLQMITIHNFMLAPADWTLYRTFLAVYRHGSLTRASQVLRITQPTAGRHIEALESALGLKLFTRSPSGLQPTASAHVVGRHAAAMAGAAEAIARDAMATSTSTRGVVRITASEFSAVWMLPPALARLRDAEPEIAVEIAVGNQFDDLLRRAADIAIRMARPTQKALVARKLGSSALGAYAHRDFVARHGQPRDGSDHLSFPWIAFDKNTFDERAFRSTGLEIHRDAMVFRCDNQIAQLAAIRAGIGVGITNRLIGDRDPDLVRILPETIAIDVEYWIAMHEDLRDQPHVRAVFDALSDGVARWLRCAPHETEQRRALGLLDLGDMQTS